MEFIQDPAALAALYGPASADRGEPADDRARSPVVSAAHRAFLAQATMVVLASIDHGGVTCSPRGGAAGSLVVVQNERTLWVPDAGGGPLHQTVRNLMGDPRLGLLFMRPPEQRVLRVEGLARVSADPDALARFVQMDPPARSVLVIDVQAVRLSGPGPLRRAALWADPSPTPDDGPTSVDLP